MKADASMGPTPFSVGYSRVGQGSQEWGVASMGPTPFSVGYGRDNRRRKTGRRLASMGPTPFSVGYSLFSPRFSLVIALFGGECRHFARGSFFWLQNRARFSPVRFDFCPLFCERPFLGGSPPERSQCRFDDFAGFTRLGRRGVFGCQGTARAALCGAGATAPSSARASGGFRILGRPGRRARPARSC